MRPAARHVAPEDERIRLLLQKWVEGTATLKDVRGYTDEELYSMARAAYFYYYEGRLDEARAVFQGLYAINPLDPYFAKALGVVELAAKNGKSALAAYDVAVRLAPGDPSAYVEGPVRSPWARSLCRGRSPKGRPAGRGG